VCSARKRSPLPAPSTAARARTPRTNAPLSRPAPPRPPQAWKPAAEAYQQLAAVQMKLDSKHDAASSYVEGAKALMKVSPAEAVPMLQQVRGGGQSRRRRLGRRKKRRRETEAG